MLQRIVFLRALLVPLAGFASLVALPAMAEMLEPAAGTIPVNGLEMYYEVHNPDNGVPLVLIHGAFSAIGTSFGQVLPALAESRTVIGLEMQGHGRTADIDRRLDPALMADDVAAAIAELGYEQADIMGYSMGGFIALHLGLRHPGKVRNLVLGSMTYRLDGVHPGLMDGFGEMVPEMMYGSPWHDEYLAIAPHPEDFDRLFAKKTAMDMAYEDIPAEKISDLSMPVLLIIGDSDLVRPEHAVEMFRLLGGGVFGDMPPGLPRSQLAILPGTGHVAMPMQVDLLKAIIPAFLDRQEP